MIEVKNLSKEFVDEYGVKNILFRNLSFNIGDKEFTSVLAPVGAGKSSLLKIIKGIEKNFNGNIINDFKSQIFLIPSKPASFPWLTVKENILFGIKKYDENKVKKIIEFVGLDGYEFHIPNNRSYGFRFRILLAQALIRNSSLILLDEPFTIMDAQSRGEILILIKEVKHEFEVSFLLTTTNINEAIFLSDKIYLMKKNPGEIIKSIETNFGSEKDFSIFNSYEFIKVREEIINIYKSLDYSNMFSDLIV
ncbi:MAG: ATP-binding cassette domain-containing protein [Melioribacter sp.]|uniref:ATP-binding cassette domain-containing protein n=1 Tax=Rosettibacter primus TaxID=3111523 RepID=UPI00247D38E6|nr:ATP-binding cassette domain-containing protein [Melioribacter sp.]